MNLRVTVFLAAVGFSGLFVTVAASTAAATPLALKVAETVIVPRVKALDTAFGAQAAAWEAGCGDVVTLKKAYASAADAWAAIEHTRFGPLAKQNRAERISFWPDPRNATGRGLETLLAAPDDGTLTDERMSKASVAVQGLPVIERLLYPGKEPGEALDPMLEGRPCAIGRAVSRNLASIGSQALAEWLEPERGELARLRRDSSQTEVARADAALVLTDLATLLQVVEERKLAPLSGGGGKVANPRVAEAWRSGRSRRNLALNLVAAADTLTALQEWAAEIVGEAVPKLRDAARDLENSGGGPVGFSVIAAINNVRYDVSERLPQALGIPLGFNSLDGD